MVPSSFGWLGYLRLVVVSVALAWCALVRCRELDLPIYDHSLGRTNSICGRLSMLLCHCGHAKEDHTMYGQCCKHDTGMPDGKQCKCWQYGESPIIGEERKQNG